MHDDGPSRDSLVDLNRAGTPLLEIVSQPEMTSPEEARAYLDEIRLLLRELEVSDCEMQEGSLRCDANVNVHVPVDTSPPTYVGGSLVGGSLVGGSLAATPIVEIKNLNSIRGVERALKYEADRQFHELKTRLGSDWELGLPSLFAGTMVRPVCEKRNGQLVPVSKATAGWDDRLGQTKEQRRKEEASDYRYFPEPDLVPSARISFDCFSRSTSASSRAAVSCFSAWRCFSVVRTRVSRSSCIRSASSRCPPNVQLAS